MCTFSQVVVRLSGTVTVPIYLGRRAFGGPIVVTACLGAV